MIVIVIEFGEIFSLLVLSRIVYPALSVYVVVTVLMVCIALIMILSLRFHRKMRNMCVL